MRGCWLCGRKMNVDRTARRRGHHRRGHRGEWLAALALRLKGYRILARRYRTPLGEIDLIARRGDLVIMVEVKVRSDLVSAMEAVSFPAQRRIEGAADIWLSRQPVHGRYSIRFDLVAILPRRWPVHVPNLFEGRN